MTERFQKGVYGLDVQPAVRDYYDRWAKTYDAELTESGYATPARCAAALRAAGVAQDAELLDMGCGTGLSGLAFAAEGFTNIDGCDLSSGMLAEARGRGLYRALHLAEEMPETTYDAVAAVGVIGAGAGPPELLDTCLSHLKSGGHFVFSFNDHALAVPEYPARLAHITASGAARIVHRERGDHIPAMDIKSVVYTLEKA
ncbi:MAG: class I SAM-dependent DNA methyltransferase [Roseicyclus sp.]